MKIFNMTLLSLLLALTSINSYAGKIYRFLDRDGVSTMSKSLPPYAAQRGYDVLDDSSLRLIERVYTRTDLIKIQKEQKRVEDIKQKKRQKIEAVRIKKAEQRAKDRNLIARYPTEQVFLKSRNADLHYRQSEIEDIKIALAKHKQRLLELQTVAAESEINGEVLSESLKKHLENTQKAIQDSIQSIDKAIKAKAQIAAKHETDLTRLKELLSVKDKTLN